VLGPAHVLAVTLLVTATSGCTVLDLLLGVSGAPPFDPDDPFPVPSAEATFTTGEATLKINGETIVLDEVVADSGISFGAVRVVWENEDGWYLTYNAFPDEPFLGGGYISIERIADHEHRVVADPTRCIATTDVADAAGVSGTATCRGLRWADYFSQYSGTGEFPQPLASEPPFDAEVTFEAHGAVPRPTPARPSAPAVPAALRS
jgi:hypothetical protein